MSGGDELAHLVRGANRIGEFFAAMPDAAEARAGIAGHLRRYWAPALRQRLLAHLQATGGEGLSPLVRQALHEGLHEGLQQGLQAAEPRPGREPSP